MAIYDDNLGYNGGSPDGKTSWLGIRNTKTVGVTLDFGRINAARLAARATALVQADFISALRLKAGTIVLAAGVEVVQAESAAGARTIRLGSGIDNSVANDPDTDADETKGDSVTDNATRFLVSAAVGTATDTDAARELLETFVSNVASTDDDGRTASAPYLMKE